jgi:hypothetical protein
MQTSCFSPDGGQPGGARIQNRGAARTITACNYLPSGAFYASDFEIDLGSFRDRRGNIPDFAVCPRVERSWRPAPAGEQ